MSKIVCEMKLIEEGDFLIRPNSHPGTIILSNRQPAEIGDYNLFVSTILKIASFESLLSKEAIFKIVETKKFEGFKLINQKLIVNFIS